MIAVLLTRQIIVLFIMMFMGFLLVKLGLLQSSDSRILSVISIYLITPAVLIRSFQIDYSEEVRDGFFLAVLAGVIIHAVLFTVVYILSRFFHFAPVEKASLIYSNAGNLIIPLVSAVLGEEWVIYASGFLSVQTILLWTHCQTMMQEDGRPSLKKVFTNVNLIAIVVGILLFFTKTQLPAMVDDILSPIAATIGPISMVMLGMILANIKWDTLFKNKRIYLIVLLKMILVPGAVLVILKYSGLANLAPNSATILLISLLAVITPSATMVTQMAILYKQEETYAGAINFITTIVSIVTMPIMIYLYLL